VGPSCDYAINIHSFHFVFAGYAGKNCQYESDPCNPAECMNGGSCVGNSTHFRWVEGKQRRKYRNGWKL